jgi:ribonuclease D
VRYANITTQQDLRDFCSVIAAAPIVAFDTEFVSEDTYQPELCLVQVAAAGELAIIDPFSVGDLTPFWELLATPGRETLVHAGREEFRFCRRAIGQRPHQWFDVQLAAGLIGLEFPASYGTLVSKLLGKSLSKDETRTDWRRRPLSDRQLEYALQDVCDLEAIRHALHDKLQQLGRVAWLHSELATWQAELEAFETSERWRRTPGISGMSPRTLAVLRSLWEWRDGEAERRDLPPRRILRDDLLVELAKRQTDDPKRIRQVRGMERGDIQRHLPNICAAVKRGMELPDDACPRPEARNVRPQFNLLSQFLSTALGSICRSANVATSLVGTAQDVRDLIAYRLEVGRRPPTEPPLLAQGWRAEVVGQVIEHLLEGKLAIAIADPFHEEPLSFEARSQR